MSEVLVFDDEPEPRTALWHACAPVPTAAPGDSVAAVLGDMAVKRYNCASVVAVLDCGRLVGIAPIERMFGGPDDAALCDVMDPNPPALGVVTFSPTGVSCGAQR